MRTQVFLLSAIVAVALTGCTIHTISQGDVNDIHRLAVLVRVAPGPAVAVPMRNLPDGQQLQQRLAKQVKPFEVEERLRGQLLSKLPKAPPWSYAMPAADVATALATLLVVDSATPRDYDALARSGADSVLELVVTEWGVVQNAKPALYLKGNGQLMLLPSQSRIWNGTLDTNLSSDQNVDEIAIPALLDGGFRDAVIALIESLTDRLARELAK